MFKNILLILVIFLCLLAISGSLLLGPVSQRLTSEDEGTTIALKVGDELLVTLPGNLSTGYSWEIMPVEDALLVQVGEPEFKAQSDQVGAPGEITLHFKAVAAGEQTLKLIYNRPWEADVEALDTFEFTVIVE